jgi:hypothetical protein
VSGAAWLTRGSAPSKPTSGDRQAPRRRSRAIARDVRGPYRGLGARRIGAGRRRKLAENRSAPVLLMDSHDDTNHLRMACLSLTLAIAICKRRATPAKRLMDTKEREGIQPSASLRRPPRNRGAGKIIWRVPWGNCSAATRPRCRQRPDLTQLPGGRSCGRRPWRPSPTVGDCGE